MANKEKAKKDYGELFRKVVIFGVIFIIVIIVLYIGGLGDGY